VNLVSKTQTITIKVPPTLTNRWLVNWGSGGHPAKKRNATALYNAIEKRILRRLPRLDLKKKIAIRVKYGIDSINETYKSNNPSYLLFNLACFLEDYLTPEFLSQRHKKYMTKGQLP